jgi:hypothetical protein
MGLKLIFGMEWKTSRHIYAREKPGSRRALLFAMKLLIGSVSIGGWLRLGQGRHFGLDGVAEEIRF